MSGALVTVQDYVTAARVLLQDLVVPLRYDDQSVLYALNEAFLTSRRLRPDMYIKKDVPSYVAIDTTPVDMEEQFRPFLVTYMVAQVQLRDEETEQDQRAIALFKMAHEQLVGTT